MGRRLAYVGLVIGAGLFALGIAATGLPSMLWQMGPTLVLASIPILCVLLLLRIVHVGLQEVRQRRAYLRASVLTESLTAQLFGDHTPFVIEAAEQLGEARDSTAVPALLVVLENCVDAQRPCWREVAETLVNALSRIGDRRALPLLYRLENVRGIGLIPAIRDAIATIEPQTSLLRPGSADAAIPATLLRPAQDNGPDSEAATLLRADPNLP